MSDDIKTPRGAQYRCAFTNAKTILSETDLKPDTAPATFMVTNGSETSTITVAGLNRQVLETLMEAPLVCASTVRLAANVHCLAGKGVMFDTIHNAVQLPGKHRRSAIYVLKSDVRRVEEGGE
ncbi:hypothetical protein [Pseudooceanicola sp. MF1-13]|uniref:hypothetical protein n=1 Tax=Pseudooceanicola sp. MF1-13 TaxID=3379095 RepID=UPI0038924580